LLQVASLLTATSTQRWKVGIEEAPSLVSPQPTVVCTRPGSASARSSAVLPMSRIDSAAVGAASRSRAKS
jgi:hypothetical protein